MRAKSLKPGDVVGNRRVIDRFQRGVWVYYWYEYRVVDEHPLTRDPVSRWYRQAIPPMGRVHVNKVIQD